MTIESVFKTVFFIILWKKGLTAILTFINHDDCCSNFVVLLWNRVSLCEIVQIIELTKYH